MVVVFITGVIVMLPLTMWSTYKKYLKWFFAAIVFVLTFPIEYSILHLSGILCICKMDLRIGNIYQFCVAIIPVLEA